MFLHKLHFVIFLVATAALVFFGTSTYFHLDDPIIEQENRALTETRAELESKLAAQKADSSDKQGTIDTTQAQLDQFIRDTKHYSTKTVYTLDTVQVGDEIGSYTVTDISAYSKTDPDNSVITITLSGPKTIVGRYVPPKENTLSGKAGLELRTDPVQEFPVFLVGTRYITMSAIPEFINQSAATSEFGYKSIDVSANVDQIIYSVSAGNLAAPLTQVRLMSL